MHPLRISEQLMLCVMQGPFSETPTEGSFSSGGSCGAPVIAPQYRHNRQTGIDGDFLPDVIFTVR